MRSKDAQKQLARTSLRTGLRGCSEFCFPLTLIFVRLGYTLGTLTEVLGETKLTVSIMKLLHNVMIKPHHIRTALQDIMKKPQNVMKRLQHIAKKPHNIMK